MPGKIVIFAPNPTLHNMMKQYLIRSAKYIVWFFLLFVVVFLLMILTGGSQVGPAESLDLLFGSSRGTIMICAIVFLALLYPRYGFVRREVAADLYENREALLTAFSRSGYRLVSESESEWVFRVTSGLKRALLLWEDTIRVVPTPTGFTLEGLRREAVKVEFRLRPLLRE